MSQTSHMLTLAELANPVLVRELVSHHVSAPRVRGSVNRITELATRVQSLRVSPGRPEGGEDGSRAVVVYAPGRIEVLGKHTDYAGGTSLTCAVDRSFMFVATITKEPGVRLQDVVFSSSDFLPYRDTRSSLKSSWLSYPASVVERFVANFLEPSSGVTIAFSNTIPRASGMSSSGALIVGVYLCLAALLEPDRTTAFKDNLTSGAALADYLGSVENGFSYGGLAGREGVGTRAGAQDHTAVLFSESGTLGHFGYRPLTRLGRVALPANSCFVVASSGVRAQKSRGALEPYNNVVALAETGLSQWNQAYGSSYVTLGSLVRSGDFTMEALEGVLGGGGVGGGVRADDLDRVEAAEARAVIDRITQFTEETGSILPAAIRALELGDLEAFGAAVERSQELTDKLLRNQVAETRFLAHSARKCGAIAASAFGAGFGGSVWALVDIDESGQFMRQWMLEYGTAYPERIRNAHFFVDSTGPGAFVLGASPERLLLEPKF